MWQSPMRIGEYLKRQHYEQFSSGRENLHHHPEIVSTEFAFLGKILGWHSLSTSEPINEQQTYEATKNVYSTAYCRNESTHLLIVSNISLQEGWKVETCSVFSAQVSKF